MAIPPRLGRKTLICKNRMHHVQVRLVFWYQKLWMMNSTPRFPVIYLHTLYHCKLSESYGDTLTILGSFDPVS